MSETCETVKVKNAASASGFMIINKADMTKEHELWVDKPAARKPDPLDHDGDGRKGGSRPHSVKAKTDAP